MDQTVSSNAETGRLQLMKEVSAPKGYKECEEIHTVEVVQSTSDSSVRTVKCEEPVKSDPAGITLYKIDQETGDFTTQGAATLAGAQFTVTHYGGYYTQAQIEAGQPEEDGVEVRTWVIQTKEDSAGACRANLLSSYFVSGDDYYKDDIGAVVLPLGTVTIEETKAPTGYLLEGGIFIEFSFRSDTPTLVAGGRAVIFT